jgi:hypothetical protein
VEYMLQIKSGGRYKKNDLSPPPLAAPSHPFRPSPPPEQAQVIPSPDDRQGWGRAGAWVMAAKRSRRQLKTVLHSFTPSLLHCLLHSFIIHSFIPCTFTGLHLVTAFSFPVHFTHCALLPATVLSIAAPLAQGSRPGGTEQRLTTHYSLLTTHYSCYSTTRKRTTTPLAHRLTFQCQA